MCVYIYIYILAVKVL